MVKGASTPTRISADVAGAAAAIAPAEHRTATEQINFWARIGMQFERNLTLNRRRVLAAVDGTGQFADLDPDERGVAHALVDANIAHRTATQRFGAVRRTEGQRTVSVDDDGHLIEIAADGTQRRL